MRESVTIDFNQRAHVDWSHSNGLIAISKRGEDNFYDVYTMNPDGTNERCLTCNVPELTNEHIGQPAWHPDGRYLVFQATMKDHPPFKSSLGPLASSPGSGTFNELWIMDVLTNTFTQVTDLPPDSNFGTLHPHFSHDGTKLSWSQMYRKASLFAKNAFKGYWRLHIADFNVNNGIPEISNEQTYEPGIPGMYENHGFSTDDSKIIYQSNTEADSKKEETDLWQMDLKTEKLEKLTETHFNEHGIYSPDGTKIAFMSSAGNENRGKDWWIMKLDGSCKKRLTFFNDPTHRDYLGRMVICADLSWSPDGNSFIGYLFDALPENISSGKISGEAHVMVKLSDQNKSGDTIPISNSMVHAHGTQIVNATGQPLKLYGVLLEGWLMWNGPLWGAGLTSETKITGRLEKMAGKTETEKFRTAIYENFITEKDIAMIADIGFNVVRVPFNHTIFEDGSPPGHYTAIGWKYLDNLLDWCEKHEVYVILDFHSLPGGQGSFVSDPEFIKVWHKAEYQQQAIDVWKAIANRYKNREIIAGYDLINEPDAPSGKKLVELYRRIISAIREVDKYHMIILEGSHYSSNFSMFDNPLDRNQAYGFHSYNLFGDASDKANLEKLSTIAKKQDVPLWNGEFGAHKLDWVKEELKLYEDTRYPINGWIFWPWKRVSENSDRYRELAKIRVNDEWKKVAEGIYDLLGPNKKITNEFANKAMNDFIESIKAENLVFDEEMKSTLSKALKNDFNIRPEVNMSEN